MTCSMRGPALSRKGKEKEVSWADDDNGADSGAEEGEIKQPSSKKARGSSPKVLSTFPVPTTREQWIDIRNTSTVGMLAPDLTIDQAHRLGMGFRSFFGSGSATDPFQPLSQLDAASQALVPAAPASSKQVAKAAPPVAPAQATAPKPKPPPSAHIRQGNSKDGAKTIIIHLTQSLSESITPISTEDFVNWFNLALKAKGKINQAVGANIKQSGYRDVFVACVNCPDHDEFEAITAAVTEKLRALIPHDDVGIQVEYQTVLTSMAIRDCRWSYKDARNTLQNRGSDYFWNTLNEAAKVDKHTRNFVEACIPFHNLPNARLEGRNGGGNIFWKRNMQKAWFDNAVKGIEKVVDQQKHVDNVIRTLRTKAKRVAKAAADDVASGSGETFEARIGEVTGMPVDQS
ncbi:uncharacterized protein B0H18DRAFT_1127204 [Fomitopsis serialis]|uniref:uncharacterized protein n=1 Tax=Fomitopsis serialis TaxID=139415 RepID=UPI0020075DCE|nr:uncharacterized protein B0H18DRAFT_1127204 [Neoantrodia serialis]KAH9912418.1 hypothetical protein B0H18DRAFT_1127204 [Neoantrodia serialis]